MYLYSYEKAFDDIWEDEFCFDNQKTCISSSEDLETEEEENDKEEGQEENEEIEKKDKNEIVKEVSEMLIFYL